MSNEVQVTLTVEEREALKSINKLEKSVGDFAKNSQSSIKRADVAMASFAANLASGAVIGAVKFIANSIKDIFSGAIDGANQQEAALNKLANSLKITSSFSKAAVKDFEAFASAIQATTKFGDEVVLNQLAIAKTFGATNDQAKQVVRTATDLATALGTSLDSAVEQLSGTLNGSIGRLGKIVPELKNLSEEQLKAGEGLRILSERFKGFAESDARSFSGATIGLKNALGDLGEEFGLLITQSPEIRLFVNDTTKLIQSLTGSVKGLAPAVKFTADAVRVLFGGVADTEKARQAIENIDTQIKALQETLKPKEGERSLLQKIFGGVDEEAINSQIQSLVTQKAVLEAQITDVEKASQDIRKENQVKFAEDSIARSKRLYAEQVALDKAITAQKDKEAKLQREIQNTTLSSTSQFIGATAALFKNNSREQKGISIATATIDTYVAANKALASGSALSPVAGFAAAAAAIATGLANVARITSVGSFQNGGFIGGNSYSGDKLTANVNSGEAVLNASQQKNFMELANNGVAGNNASIDLLDEIRNLKNAIMQQPIVVAVSGREIARVVRDERAAGFAI